MRLSGDDNIVQATKPATTVVDKISLPSLNIDRLNQNFDNVYKRDIFHIFTSKNELESFVQERPVEKPEPIKTEINSQIEKIFDSVKVLGSFRSNSGYNAMLNIDGVQDVFKRGQAPIEGFVIETINLNGITLLHKETGLAKEITINAQ